MRILKVWDYEYPWDVRAEKVCKALTNMGHEVHMVARNRRREPLLEAREECTVHRMAPWPWAGRSLDAASQFPAFFNPRWLNLIARVGERSRADVMLVRDIPLAPTAIHAGRRLGIPVVLDMAEHYAAMMRDLWNTGTTTFGDWFVRNPKAVEWVERWVLARADHTLVVVDESKERLVANGVPPSKVSIVGNTPALARLDEFASLRRSRRATAYRESGPPPNRTKLIYLGLMEEARGVRQVIDAVAAVRATGLDVTLDLVGDGRSLDSFKARAVELGLSESEVRFHGFVPYDEALALVAGMDAGLIPHFASESWKSTIPNKLFDYMSLGLPVIASDVKPVKRILAETEAGIVFRDRDQEDLIRAIRSLHGDPGRGRSGEKGVEAVRTRYHFERDARILSEVLASLVESSSAPPHEMTTRASHAR